MLIFSLIWKLERARIQRETDFKIFGRKHTHTNVKYLRRKEAGGIVLSQLTPPYTSKRGVLAHYNKGIFLLMKEQDILIRPV